MMLSAGYFVIMLAVIGANLPFLNQRFFCVWPLPGAYKRVWFCLTELTVWYFIVGFVAVLLENQIGQRFVQGWQFYAVTAALFLVCAFPGFIFRYLYIAKAKPLIQVK